MKSFLRFVEEGKEHIGNASAAQSAWQKWMNDNPSEFQRGGRFYQKGSGDSVSTASKEFMKQYMKTGEIPNSFRTISNPSGTPQQTTSQQRPPTGTQQRPTGTQQRPTGTQRPTGSQQRPPGSQQRPPTGTQQRPPTGTQQRPPVGTNKKPKINFGKIANRLNLGLNTYMGVEDLYAKTKERTNRGEKLAPAAAKSSAEVGGGFAGAALAGRAAAPYIARNVRNPWLALGLGSAASIGGYVAGEKGTSKIIRRLEGSQPDYSKVAQSRATKYARANSASRNVYGASQGSAIAGIGGNSFVTRRPSGAAFMSTGAGSQRRTVQLPRTQLVRDPRSGRQTVGDLAYRNGTPVYLSRASTASRDSNYTAGGMWRNLQRNLNFGGQRERDRAAARREYRTALGNTQRYTGGLNISPQSAKRKKLPGY